MVGSERSGVRAGLWGVIVCLLAVAVAACAGERNRSDPGMGKAATVAAALGVPLWSGTLETAEGGEAILLTTAEAPGTSWAEKGREAAVLSVSLDGQYLGDLVLFMGGEAHEYAFAIGPVAAGEHPLALHLAPEKGTKAAVQVSSVRWSVYTAEDALYPALSHSPLLYGRPVMNRSDTPLLGYFEQTLDARQTTLAYTVIFSNEDGGTNPPGLMARWGRLTDIEWVYSVTLDGQGRVTQEIIQAKDHRTQPFAGQHRGDHPILRVVTDNNMVGDSGRSDLLFAPAFLSPLPPESPREVLMDCNPWSYRIMAEEWSREGMEVPGRVDTVAVSDPCNYLYVTYKARLEYPKGGTVCPLRLAAAVYDSEANTWYSSDHNNADLRVTLDGWRRIAIELPPGSGSERLSRLRLRVYGSVGEDASLCRLVIEAVGPVFLLDEGYRPGPALWSWQGHLALGADETTGEPAELVLSR